MGQSVVDAVNRLGASSRAAATPKHVAVLEFDETDRDGLYRLLANAPCRVVLIEEPPAMK